MIELVDLEKPLSLYIHVPFCKIKCGYCAFYSIPESQTQKEMVDKYYSIVKQKLEAFLCEFKRPFYTIFIGGGNPGLLGYERLKELLTLAQKYGKSEEVTIEINPENVNEEIFTLSPVLTRVSVGIQSFNPDKLKVLERNTNAEANKRALSILREMKERYGTVINGDLICCVPGESVNVLADDISTLASFDVDHISMYSLAFEEGTRLTSRYAPLSDDEQITMMRSAQELLSSLGFEHYEVSAYAKNGAYCRHNQVYWNLGQYIGFGPTAESSLGYKNVVSMREKSCIEEYLKKPEFDAVPLTNIEAQEEYLLTTLRTKTGIDKEEYKARFGTDFDSLYKEAIEESDPTFYVDNKDRFAITEEGVMMLDTIIFKLFCNL